MGKEDLKNELADLIEGLGLPPADLADKKREPFKQSLYVWIESLFRQVVGHTREGLGHFPAAFVQEVQILRVIGIRHTCNA